MNITVGVQITPQYGDMGRMRAAWMEAEALGADRIYTCDHFHAMIVPKINAGGAEVSTSTYGKNFEGTTLQAAMAVTTRRAEIGCLVHAIGYRNPNLLADIARTIDHLCGGRFVLGLGSGYLQPDYEDYGYEFGTAASRMRDLDRAIPIIQDRFTKLNPQPLRKIPLLIAALGEKVGLRIAAQYADIWHVYGPMTAMEHKEGVFREWCQKVGRDHTQVERATFYVPELLADADPEAYVKLGFTHIILTIFGPDWDLGIVRELIAWRDAARARGDSAAAAARLKQFSAGRHSSFQDRE